MKTFQKKDLTPMLAGVAFLLMAAIKLTHLISGFSFSFILLFSCIACVALSALIFMKKRNVLIGIIIATFVAPAIFLQLYDIGWLIPRGINYVLPMISDLLCIFAHISLALLAYTSISKHKEKSKLFWFIPAGLMIAGELVLFVYWHDILAVSLENLLQIAAYATLSVWLAYPDGLPTKVYVARNSGKTSKTAYCELGRHIVLLLFTFGIYHLYWVYRASAYIGTEEASPKNPRTQLLLYIFVPFYFIYWTYTSARFIDALANSKGLKSNRALICLIISCVTIPSIIFALPSFANPFILFTPLILVSPSILIIPPILMQARINAIAFAENEYMPY